VSVADEHARSRRRIRTGAIALALLAFALYAGFIALSLYGGLHR